MSDETSLYSIGELSARTGIAAHTLRVWERRHDRPTAVRLPSGHRRYTEDQLRWTQMVAELLAYGHKPGKLMPLEEEGLQNLLDEERCRNAADPDFLDELLRAGLEGGATALRMRLAGAIQEHGPRLAVHQVIAPFVHLIGQRWEEGSIGIRDEHMASEVVQDVLGVTRAELGRTRSIADTREPDLILATLPGERHGLGLDMVHLLAEIDGAVVQQLGVDLPVEEIAAAAIEHPSAAVGVSVSRNSAGPATERALEALRGAMPEGSELVVGGNGALVTRRRVKGATYFGNFGQFEAWLAERMAS